jgi:drug/metabolite transporter (DMT)-like permease
MWASLALSFPLAKLSLGYASPAYVIGFRMVLAGLGLLLFQVVSGHFQEKKGAILPNNRKDWWALLRIALFNVYFAFVPEFWALQYLGSLKVTLLYASCPFWSALFSYFLESEKLCKTKKLALTVGLLGVVPTLLTNSAGEFTFKTLFSVSLPELVLLGAIISASYAWFEVKTLSARGYSILSVNGASMLLGGLFSFLHYFAFNPTSPILPVDNFWSFLGIVSALIILSNVIFYNLYGWLLHRFSFTFLSFTGFLCPIFGTIYGVTFFGEHFYWLYLVGFLMTFAGLWLFYRSEHNKVLN